MIITSGEMVGEKLSVQDKCYEKIYVVAKKARIIVFPEQAYDIIDEISRSSNDPVKVLDGLQKLSRLAIKVINDLPELKDKKAIDEDERKSIDEAIKSLKYWANDFQDFIECLKSSDQKSLSAYVKTFATLSISPDPLSLKIKEIKER